MPCNMVYIAMTFNANYHMTYCISSPQPPPPGVAPTPAQKAAAKGKPVVMTQNKASKLLMGSSGGYCFGGL